jgi:uncharacterized protein YPO0396
MSAEIKITDNDLNSLSLIDLKILKEKVDKKYEEKNDKLRRSLRHDIYVALCEYKRYFPNDELEVNTDSNKFLNLLSWDVIREVEPHER